MAVTTPSIIGPVTASTGLSLESELGFLFTDFAGTGSHAEGRLRISTVVGMTALVHDSLLRPSDGLMMGDFWYRIHPADFDGQASTTYYADYQRQSDVPEISTASAVINFTFGAAKLTAANWRKGQ